MHCLKKKDITTIFGNKLLLKQDINLDIWNQVYKEIKAKIFYFQYLIPNCIRYLCNYKQTDN